MSSSSLNLEQESMTSMPSVNQWREKFEECIHEIRRKINNLENENFADYAIIHEAKNAIEEKKDTLVDFSDINRLYEAAGIQLPGVALRKIDSVKEFHNSITINRNIYLQQEINEAKKRIENRCKELELIQSKLHSAT